MIETLAFDFDDDDDDDGDDDGNDGDAVDVVDDYSSNQLVVTIFEDETV